MKTNISMSEEQIGGVEEVRTVPLNQAKLGDVVLVDDHCEALRVTDIGFYQKKLRYSFSDGDCCTIWRRSNRGIETWLCVIWHDNWQPVHRGSNDETNSYLRQTVEHWAVNTLLRIHHSFDEIEKVRANFRALAREENFDNDVESGNGLPELYETIHGRVEPWERSDDSDEYVYLSDGCWLGPDGNIECR